MANPHTRRMCYDNFHNIVFQHQSVGREKLSTHLMKAREKKIKIKTERGSIWPYDMTISCLQSYKNMLLAVHSVKLHRIQSFSKNREFPNGNQKFKRKTTESFLPQVWSSRILERIIITKRLTFWKIVNFLAGAPHSWISWLKYWVPEFQLPGRCFRFPYFLVGILFSRVSW